MTGRKRGRPQGGRNEGAHIYWRNGRAYGDFRQYRKEGGRREALSEADERRATTDPVIARALFNARVEQLRAKRQGRAGAPQQMGTTLAELVRHHLIMKAKAGRTSDSHLFDIESRLRSAIEYFGAGRDPITIVPHDVRSWSEALSGNGRRKPGTVRHYLNALSGLYGRAQEALHVTPGYNPVSALQEKPTGYTQGEAKFFEVAEAALLLEAARVLEGKGRKGAGPRVDGGVPGPSSCTPKRTPMAISSISAEIASVSHNPRHRPGRQEVQESHPVGFSAFSAPASEATGGSIPHADSSCQWDPPASRGSGGERPVCQLSGFGSPQSVATYLPTIRRPHATRASTGSVAGDTAITEICS